MNAAPPAPDWQEEYLSLIDEQGFAAEWIDISTEETYAGELPYEEPSKCPSKRSSLTPYEVLKKYWGFDDFRPKQLEIIESVLAGRDTLGLLPTGGGKSMTFQIPGLILPGLTIVVTPLIALMKDQVDHLHAKGIKAKAIHSGMARFQIVAALEACMWGGIKFLYLSPERLSSPLFQSVLPHLEVSMIVVDECHCISQWGYDFRPSYLQIAGLREAVPEAPVLALTATATPQVAADVMERLSFAEPYLIQRSFVRENLTYVVRKTDDKLGTMLHIFSRIPGSAIVYCRNRKRTQELAEALCANGVSADYFHAGLPHAERNVKQERWMANEIRVMVATNAFGMGIDKAEVHCVIHCYMPSSLEEYFQEAGRAGRDGKQAYAVVLVGSYDEQIIRRRVQDEFPPKDFIWQVYEQVNDTLGIGQGEGLGCGYDFDVEQFIIHAHSHPLRTLSAIRILDMARVWRYTDGEERHSRVMMRRTKDELYQSGDIYPAEEQLLNMLLRTYPGLFTQYVFIEEEQLAIDTQFTLDEVFLLLKALAAKRVLSFIPRTSIPHLYFLTRREEGRSLIIPQEVYEKRREKMEERVKAVLNYIKQNHECRSQTLVRYFGETDSPPCGRCDACLANRKHKYPHKRPEEYIAWLLERLPRSGDRISLSTLYQEWPSGRVEPAECLRELLPHCPELRIDGRDLVRS